MIDRESSNLRRMRRYTDPFEEDEGETSEREGYVKWFGLWVRERTLFIVGFSIAGLMLAIIVARTLFAGRVAWLPAGTLWFEIGFLVGIMVMSFVSCSMFVCGSIALRKQIRHMNAQMARWDNATPEEVEEIVRAADRRLNRRVLWRTVVLVVVVAALCAIFGTTLLFRWGGVPAFVASMVAFVALSFAWSWKGHRILSFVVRRIKRST